MLKVLGVTLLIVGTIIDSEVLCLAVTLCFAVAGALKVLEWAAMAG